MIVTRQISPIVLAAFVGLTACAGSQNETTPNPAGSRRRANDEGAAAPPRLRLPSTARPTRYAASLAIAPERDTFSGAIDIDLVVTNEVRVLWLNGTRLRISKASATVGTESVATSTVPGGDNFIGFSFAQPIPPGSARLHVEYTGQVSSTDFGGVFRQNEGDDWYVFTQFEATDARRAFPCFDEPAFKVPWQLEIEAPNTLEIASNTPIESESAPTRDTKRVRFLPTPPLPSYLIAFAVGPFDAVAGSPVGKNRAPFRVLAPRGAKIGARYAASIAPELIARLEDYFGIPYPYAKLDVVAVPLFLGAMENPGLITFNQAGLLAKPADENIPRQRRCAETLAHEFAHQWFGNLVTLAWWDDIWLNESFAEWAGNKIIAAWRPTWGLEVDAVRERHRAMTEDGLLSARKIRQPIETDDDITNVFDGITYAKGASVLQMFENWIGPDRFRDAVRRHLDAKAHGIATAEDFFAALSAAGGADLASVFSDFIDQPGVPLVAVDLACNKGAPPTVRLRQSRYLPAGSKDGPSARWKIPFCVRFASRHESGRACALFSGETMELPLPAAKSCPELLIPNPDFAGYYRIAISERLDKTLRSRKLRGVTVAEKVGLALDAQALVESGDMPAERALRILPLVSADGNRHTLTAAMRVVDALRPFLVPDAELPNHRRFIRSTFAKRAHELGLVSRPTDTEDLRLLRPSLAKTVGGDGDDPRLVEDAKRLTARWLREPKDLDADVADVVFRIAARNGDDALFEAFLAKAKLSTDRVERRRFLGALASFRDRALVERFLRALLEDTFDLREVQLWDLYGNPDASEVVYDFVKTNFDVLVSRLPEERGLHLLYVGTAFCDGSHAADVESFFRERATKLPGGPRILAQVLEEMRQCIAVVDAQQASVVKFLRSQNI